MTKLGICIVVIAIGCVIGIMWIAFHEPDRVPIMAWVFVLFMGATIVVQQFIIGKLRRDNDSLNRALDDLSSRLQRLLLRGYRRGTELQRGELNGRDSERPVVSGESQSGHDLSPTPRREPTGMLGINQDLIDDVTAIASARSAWRPRRAQGFSAKSLPVRACRHGRSRRCMHRIRRRPRRCRWLGRRQGKLPLTVGRCHAPRTKRHTRWPNKMDCTSGRAPRCAELGPHTTSPRSALRPRKPAYRGRQQMILGR
jgi:hypothetical protein